MFGILPIPGLTFIDGKLIVIPAAPLIVQVQLHWVVEAPLLWNLLYFLLQEGDGGRVRGPGTPSHRQPPHTSSQGSTSTPHPLLRGQQVSSEDVVIDTLVTEPQGEGALNKERPGWVVVGQGSLLVGTLDAWCGDTSAWGLCPKAQGVHPAGPVRI